MTEPNGTGRNGAERPSRRRRRTVPEPEPYPWTFWPAVVIGTVLMAVGVRGLLANSADTQPVRWVVLFLASAVIHDVVLAPVVIAVGWLLSRRLGPNWLRAPLQGALICSGAVVLVAFPLVRGYGRQSGNDTILPLDYGRGLLLVLAAIWVGTAAVVGVGRFRRAGASRRFVDSLGSDIGRIDAGTGAPIGPGLTQSIADHALLSDCQGAALVDRT
ncbi:MAG: hypothetical protein H0U26_09565, partial [Acidimicrobiia bacterium]|nr:hypothetical protein [Acidimicrobiia bacterium]